MNHGILYVGVDVHEKESQLAVLEKEGALVMEERIPTKDLGKFLSYGTKAHRLDYSASARRITFSLRVPFTASPVEPVRTPMRP
jgi:hypothetical protein